MASANYLKRNHTINTYTTERKDWNKEEVRGRRKRRKHPTGEKGTTVQWLYLNDDIERLCLVCGGVQRVESLIEQTIRHENISTTPILHELPFIELHGAIWRKPTCHDNYNEKMLQMWLAVSYIIHDDLASFPGHVPIWSVMAWNWLTAHAWNVSSDGYTVY